MKTAAFSSIELLESRIALAAFTVTSLADPSEAGKVTLRDALALADARPGPDTIVFKLPAPPLHGENIIKLTGGVLTSRGNVNIVGPGAGKLIIDGDAKSGVFFISDASPTDQATSISGLSIVNGRAVAGAGILSLESLTLKSVTVARNVATDSNAGIEVLGDGLTGKKFSMSNSLVSGNEAANFSGGVALAGVLSVSITNSIVIGNKATAQNGGGIAVVLGSTSTGLVISGSQITGNTADFGAGLVLVNNNPSPSSKMVISGTKITGNKATGTSNGGGGIFLGAGHTVITGSTISSNTTAALGGGIAAIGFSSLTLTGSSVAGNSADSGISAGGGIYVAGTGTGPLEPVKIISSVIAGNHCGGQAGGIQARDGVELTISNSTVSANQSGVQGGGIHAVGSGDARVSLTVVGGAVSDNVAGGSGGGIYAGGDGAISISAVKVLRNASDAKGGGIMVDRATAAVVIANVVVSGNAAFENSVVGSLGGGLSLSSVGTFKVSGGSFSGNVAPVGGGIGVENSVGSIIGATVTGNFAPAGGGISSTDSTVSILGTAVTGNAASAGGGVLKNGSGTVTLQIAKVIANSAPNGPNVSGTFIFV